MKLNEQFRRVTPTTRIRRGRTVPKLTRVTLPVVTALALVASALLTGAAFVTAMEVVPVTIPVLLVGWTAGIGFAFALPMLVVRGVVAVLERTQ